MVCQYLITHSRFLFHDFFQSPCKTCKLLATTAPRDNDFHSSAVHYIRNYQCILCHPKLALNHKKGQCLVWSENWVLLLFGCYSNQFSTINLRTRVISIKLKTVLWNYDTENSLECKLGKCFKRNSFHMEKLPVEIVCIFTCILIVHPCAAALLFCTLERVQKHLRLWKHLQANGLSHSKTYRNKAFCNHV